MWQSVAMEIYRTRSIPASLFRLSEIDQDRVLQRLRSTAEHERLLIEELRTVSCVDADSLAPKVKELEQLVIDLGKALRRPLARPTRPMRQSVPRAFSPRKRAELGAQKRLAMPGKTRRPRVAPEPPR